MSASRPAVEVLHRHLVEVQPLDAAQVDRRRFGAVRGLAEAEGRAAAIRAEMMVDDMLVEPIGGEVIDRQGQLHLAARDEPQQIALAAAMRAVALDRLAELALDLETHLAAMAASRMHERLLFRQSLQTAISLPAGSAKWKRRPPGKEKIGRTIFPPASITALSDRSRFSE